MTSTLKDWREHRARREDLQALEREGRDGDGPVVSELGDRVRTALADHHRVWRDGRALVGPLCLAAARREKPQAFARVIVALAVSLPRVFAGRGPVITGRAAGRAWRTFARRYPLAALALLDSAAMQRVVRSDAQELVELEEQAAAEARRHIVGRGLHELVARAAREQRRRLP